MNNVRLRSWAAAALVLASVCGARADDCVVSEVNEHDTGTPQERVGVKCSNGPALGVEWIMISTSNAARAQRFLSLAMAALLSGKIFRVLLAPADQGIPGCSAPNCRTVIHFGVVNY